MQSGIKSKKVFGDQESQCTDMYREMARGGAAEMSEVRLGIGSYAVLRTTEWH